MENIKSWAKPIPNQPQMLMQPQYEFTVGRLLCGPIMEYLKKCRFKGAQIEWFESEGWIQRHFVIKGLPQHIHLIKIDLQNWFKRINEDNTK